MDYEDDEPEERVVQTKYQKVLRFVELGIPVIDDVITGNQFDYVYKPNDDTELMLTTLLQEFPSFESDLILCELGSGSGMISCTLHSWLSQYNKKPLVHVSIDVNMDASQLSAAYYAYHSLPITQINTSLFNNTVFSSHLQTLKPQLVIFNPPYVPVTQEQLDNQRKYMTAKIEAVAATGQNVREESKNMIAYSYMGGTDGLAITRKFLKALFWPVAAYFIVMGGKGLLQIKSQIESRSVLHPNSSHLTAKFEALNYQQFHNEHLYVVRFTLSDK